MTFPTVETTASSNSGSATTSHVVSLPASIQSGDLLVIVFDMRGTTQPVLTWPTGWTNRFGPTFNTRTTVEVRSRIADGTEGSSITVTSDLSNFSRHTAYRISGWGSIEAGGSATGSSADPDPASFSPSWGAADTLWLAFCGGDVVTGVRTVTGAPANYTNLLTESINSGYVGSAQRALNAASENPNPFNAGSTAWVAGVIAVEPAPPSTGPQVGSLSLVGIGR